MVNFADNGLNGYRWIEENGEKTALAYELSQKYEEILVDEFQDVNDMQNMLFL